MYNEPIIDYWGKEYNYLFENERRRLLFEKILELKIPKTELDFDKNNLLFAKYILENEPKTYLYFIGTNNEKN